MTELRRTFGPEFIITSGIQSSEQRSDWLEIHMKWPLPKKIKDYPVL